PVSLTNTIVAGNWAESDPDVGGVIGAAFNNLIGDGGGSTGLADGVNGNRVGTHARPFDPQVGPLQDNGGLTLTLALLPGSPAIDAGTPNGAPATDQRGVPHLPGLAVDIGAFEYQPYERFVARLYRDVLGR